MSLPLQINDASRAVTGKFILCLGPDSTSNTHTTQGHCNPRAPTIPPLCPPNPTSAQRPQSHLCLANQQNS